MGQTVNMVMATKIALKTESANRSLKVLKSGVRGVTTEMRANMNAARAMGDALGESQAHVAGLKDQQKLLAQAIKEAEKRQNDYNERQKNAKQLLSENAVELKKAKDRMQELRDEGKRSSQEYKDLANKVKQFNATARDIKNAGNRLQYYTKQVSDLKNKQASLTAEQEKANRQLRYQTSGLADLQTRYETLNRTTQTRIERYETERRQASAISARWDGLRTKLSVLNREYELQKNELEQVANESGKTSREYQIQAQRVDETATKIARARHEMIGMSGEAFRVNPTGFSAIDKRIVSIRDHAGRMSMAVKAGLSSIRQGAAATSTALSVVGGGLMAGANMAGELQEKYTQTKNLLITGGESAKEAIHNVGQMQKDGRDLSIRYGISQKQIADAYQELTKRGYTSSQALGAMKTMTQAAAASGEQLPDVINSSTAAMEAFGLRANGTQQMMKNTKMAVNEMAYAADMTATDFNSMGVAMEYVGPQAKALKYSVGQTAGAIGILSNNGLEADKAGTGLREVLNSLIKPSAGGAKALKSIGLSMKDFKDKSGELKPINQIMGLLEQKTKNLSGQEQGALFKAIFGATGESAAIILAKHNQELGELNSKIGKATQGSGYVSKLAQKNMGSEKAAMRQFKASVQAIGVTFGAKLLPAINKSTKALAKFLGSKQGKKEMDQLARSVGSFANKMASLFTFLLNHQKAVTRTAQVFGILWASLKVFSAVGTIRFALFGLSGSVRGLGLAGSLARGGIGLLARALPLLMNPIGATIATVATLGVTFVHFYRNSTQFRHAVNGIARSFVNAFKVMGKSIGNFFTKTVPQKMHSAIQNIKNVAKVIARAMFAPLELKLKTFEWIWNKVAGRLHLKKINFSLPGYASGTTGMSQDQMAIVNDANSQHWREALLYKNRLLPFPNIRNFKTIIPKGAQVVNGDDYYNMHAKHYASGSTNEGMLTLDHYVGGLRAEGERLHDLERDQFMQELKKQFNKELEEIKKTLLEVAKQLADAEAEVLRKKRERDSYFQQSLYDAEDRYEAVADNPDAPASEYNAAWNALQRANQSARKKEDSISQAQAKVDKIKDRQNQVKASYGDLKRWFADNVNQANTAFAMYANGGYADRPSIFGEAGPEVAIPMDQSKSATSWQLVKQVVDNFAGSEISNSQQQTGTPITQEQVVEFMKMMKTLIKGVQLGNNLQAQGNDHLKNINSYDSTKAYQDVSNNLYRELENGIGYV